VKANEDTESEIKCPKCGNILYYRESTEEILPCPHCRWGITNAVNYYVCDICSYASTDLFSVCPECGSAAITAVYEKHAGKYKGNTYTDTKLGWQDTGKEQYDVPDEVKKRIV